MARNAYNRSTGYKNTYVQGNAARKLQPERETIRIPLQTEEERIEERRQRRQKEKQIRRANRMNLVYTVAVTGVVAIIFTICYQYLNLQATVKTNATEVNELKQELSDLTTSNNEMEDEINASIDYDAIYDTAVNELGMVYPDKGQVITYDSGESEYVKQYQDIPTAK